MTLVLRQPGSLPNPADDIETIHRFLREKTPFTFIRFSDGESEILHDRPLRIRSGITLFRGRTFPNDFPVWDSKTYIPQRDSQVRSDLVEAATSRADALFKGVLTRSNRRLSERDMMIRLNGFELSTLTFTDLLINSNFAVWQKTILPMVAENASSLFVVANFRSRPEGILRLAHLIPISDNFFDAWTTQRDFVLASLMDAPSGSLVLSSASSLSNVVGHRLRVERPDLTFLDVGTSINTYLGLGDAARIYLQSQTRPQIATAIRRQFGDHKIKW